MNTLTDEKEIAGNGWLFVCAPLDQLERILSAMLPRQYLVTDYNTHRAAVIPQSQMEEFIYLYESMPYNIELMNRPLEDYLQKKQKIRITGGVFGERRVHHAFAPEYPAGVRFRKYDGGGELSSCFSVREDRIAMADIFIQLGICKVFI